MILEVIETLNTKEQEVQTQSGYWYALRIRPYRTTENQIDGVVMVLIDIDALKRSAATIETARNYAETIVESVPTPLMVLDADLQVNTANRALYETFQVSSSETVQDSWFEFAIGPWMSGRNCESFWKIFWLIMLSLTTLSWSRLLGGWGRKLCC